MKWLVLGLLFPLSALASVVGIIRHDVSQETLTLYSVQEDCPKDSLRVVYFDPRDGEKSKGCYVMDTEVVIIVMQEGTFALKPLVIPKKLIKPYV
jgi:hypothetical protein